jgi:hypothetical protein
MRRLTTLFPSELLEGHAEELGVVDRNRKTQMPALVWSFVFGYPPPNLPELMLRDACQPEKSRLLLGERVAEAFMRPSNA